MYSASTIDIIDLKLRILRRYVQLCKGIHTLYIPCQKSQIWNHCTDICIVFVSSVIIILYTCILPIIIHLIIGKMKTIAFAYQTEWIRRLRRPTGAWRWGSSCLRSSRSRSYDSASQAAGLHVCGRQHPGPEDEYSSSLQNRPREKSRYL